MLFVAVAVMITVRPRELNFLRLLPFLLPLLVLSTYFASRSAVGLRAVLIPYSVIVTILWFAATTLWSGARMLSIAESIAIFCVAGIASVLGSFCSLRGLVGGVMIGAVGILALSVFVSIVIPSYGLVSGDYQAGSLKGVMLDRNSLSFVLVLGLTAILAFPFRAHLPVLKKITLLVLVFGGVLWTSSSTGLVVAVVAILLASALALIRKVPSTRRGPALAGGALLAALIFGYTISHLDDLLKLVERDSTYTGRTAIWPVIDQVISTRLWLGQGWGAVWGEAPLHRQINRSVGFEVAHSHNGYLDVQIQVGTVGLVLLLLVLASVAFKGISYFLGSDSPLSSWSIMMVVVLLIYNRVETSFSAPSTMFLIFATLVVLSRARSATSPAFV